MITSTPLVILYLQTESSKKKDIFQTIHASNPRHRILEAETLKEAELITKSHQIDVVLLELQSSEQADYKSFQRSVERLKTWPIVVITPRDNEIISIQAVRAGAQDFLAYPFAESRQLVRALQFAVVRHAQLKAANVTNKELHHHLERSRHLHHLDGTGVWEMDLIGQEMIIDDVFRNLLQFPGMMQTISQQTYLEMVHPADKQMVSDFFKKMSSSDEPLHNTHRVILHGSQINYIRLSGQIFIDVQKEEVKLLGFIREGRPSETHQGQFGSPDRSKWSSAFSFREKMLDEIGFHIRTPLYSIMNFLYLLDVNPLSKKDQQAFLGLKESIQELQQYLNRLMNYNLLTREAPAPVLRSFGLLQDLKMMIQLLSLTDEHHPIRMDIRLDKKLPPFVQGDPSLLFRTMMTLHDLFRNLEPSPRTITMNLSSEGQKGKWIHLRIQCRDPFTYAKSGYFQHILKKNHLLDHHDIQAEHENISSLHLISLETLAQSMKGSMQFNQLPNGSLRLLFSIPFQIVHLQPEQDSTTEWIQPIRILLVEDHFLNQIATKNVIQSWSDEIEVDIAENGLVALQKFSECPYDLILMDIQMPIMNGLEASKKIRQESDVPIIALSALASEQEATKCREVGINAYLPKPFQPDELKNHIFRMVSIIN